MCGVLETSLDISVVSIDDPLVLPLIAEVQQEYVARYGTPDVTPVAVAEFAPPLGVFVLVRVEGDPVACGGWRVCAGTYALEDPADTTNMVEIKRMYVAPRARGRGLARFVLVELERIAVAKGRTRVILETGTRQPEAIALYRSAGYREIPKFGHYKDDPLSVCFGKNITTG